MAFWWLYTSGAMSPLMRDFVEPTTDMRVGGGRIQRQARALERVRQRRNEAASEIAIEALDLILCPRQ